VSKDIAKEKDNVTSVAKSIPEFMEAIMEAMGTPYGWPIMVIIVVWFLFNKNLLTFLKQRIKND
jgi:hypothetical protein